MASARRLGPIPVWPYFFLSGLAAIFGTVFIFLWWPSGVPDESQLIKLSGEIDKMVVRDDFSDTNVGALMPAMTSAFFKLKEVDGEFRYPFTHPKYPLVRDYTAAAVDIWVDKAEVGKSAPATIWQIEERNPHDKPSELTVVSYDEIVARFTKISRSMQVLGYWLLAGGATLLLVGFGVIRWNRGRPHRLE
ncbi:MAG: hypothetical protein ACR2OR_10750 [Hyphomicrobiales bacterium]